LPREPSSLLGLALGVSGFFLAIAAAGTEASFGRAALAFASAVLIGFGVAKHRADSVAAPVLTKKVGPMLLQGRVDLVQQHGKGVRAVLSLGNAQRFRGEALPKRVRVFVRSGGEKLRPGDWAEARVVLLPPPPPASPGDYDFGRAAFFRQIGAVGFTFGAPNRIAPLRRATFFEDMGLQIERLRWRVSARIRAELPGSKGAIASALITGDRGGISDGDESALRDAGLAHVLAIAGLHMALVGLGLFWTVRAFLALFPAIALTQPIKKWAAVAALVSATFYLVISGAATPATRAYIMLATMLIAILFERPAISMRSLGIAATVILFLQPETIIEPGFQMSFSAVVSLVAIAEWERTRHTTSTLPLPGLRRYIRGIATTSFVGSIATAPFAAFHFDRATHYAVLGNLLAMPVMGFVTMPAAALALFLMPFGLDAIPLKVMGWGIGLMLAMGRWVSGLPGSISLVSAWPITAVVLLSIGGLWIALWRTPWRWLGLVPVLLAAAFIVTTQPPDVLVARDGITIAIRGAGGQLRFLRKPADKYSAEEWLKRDGDAHTPAVALAQARDGVNCDAYGCVMRGANGMRVAAVLKPDALEEDCAASQIVISAVPVRRHCTGPPLVIDRFDVARNGAYAIWLHNGVQVDTAQQERGERPWSMPPPRRQYRRIRPTSFP
ncbi:MAG: ComEC/Rec2 family competence protein, partial [Alphaproteobacteria bacterium]|nr:ComEC/Rec2 family competence protein [Alphaproteobacteria bacterium]